MVASSAEVKVSDGETRTLAQGDVILFEDVTGKGHTMHVIVNEPCIGLHVTRPE
jgi:hypoxanthine-guanine phosphoribosyltransferase